MQILRSLLAGGLMLASVSVASAAEPIALTNEPIALTKEPIVLSNEQLDSVNGGIIWWLVAGIVVTDALITHWTYPITDWCCDGDLDGQE